MAMTPLTGMPDRSQAQSTFDANASSFFSTKLPLFVTEANALQVDVDAKKTLAETAATNAGNSATAAAGSATAAATSATNAGNSATAAANSAASAVLSPGSQATSGSSITVGTGSQSLVLAQTGKAFVVGQFVTLARTADPTNAWMTGAITAFNSGTGAMTVSVASKYGAGTFSDWTVSQATPVAPNTVAMGALRFSQDVGTLIAPTDSDPATYLRTGTVATAATYPAGALVDYLKAYGSANVSLGQYIGDVATDGVSTIVCTYGSTNVLVSTNGGASWSTVASNLGSSALASGVCWTGSRFILAGHAGGSSVYLSYSATGSSFTAGATIAFSGGTSAGAVSIRWDGTIALVAVRNGIANCTATTTDGTGSTQRALPSSLATDPRVAVLPANGANRWIVAMTGSDSSYRSVAADGSGTWVFQTGPTVSGVKSFVATADKYIVGSGTNIYYSSTGATGSWTTVALPSISTYVGTLNVNANCNLHCDGTRLWIGAYIGTSASVYANACVYTSDLSTFASWTNIQATYPIAGQATYGAAIAPVICGTRLLFLPADGLASGSGSGHAATVSASYSANWASGADYVGHSLPVTLNADGTYSSTRFAGYVRVA